MGTLGFPQDSACSQKMGYELVSHASASGPPHPPSRSVRRRSLNIFAACLVPSPDILAPSPMIIFGLGAADRLLTPRRHVTNQRSHPG